LNETVCALFLELPIVVNQRVTNRVTETGEGFSIFYFQLLLERIIQLQTANTSNAK